MVTDGALIRPTLKIEEEGRAFLLVLCPPLSLFIVNMYFLFILSVFIVSVIFLLDSAGVVGFSGALRCAEAQNRAECECEGGEFLELDSASIN